LLSLLASMIHLVNSLAGRATVALLFILGAGTSAVVGIPAGIVFGMGVLALGVAYEYHRRHSFVAASRRG
jgi:hypothetical protein